MRECKAVRGLLGLVPHGCRKPFQVSLWASQPLVYNAGWYRSSRPASQGVHAIHWGWGYRQRGEVAVWEQVKFCQTRWHRLLCVQLRWLWGWMHASEWLFLGLPFGLPLVCCMPMDPRNDTAFPAAQRIKNNEDEIATFGGRWSAPSYSAFWWAKELGHWLRVRWDSVVAFKGCWFMVCWEVGLLYFAPRIWARPCRLARSAVGS